MTLENKRRSVCLIGSSGGGTATLGHTQPSAFVETIGSELAKISTTVSLHEVIFVFLENGQGMDSAKDDDRAALFHLRDGAQSVSKGTLLQINQKVIELEESIANDIELGKVHGLISVSCKPSLFHQTLQAAAECDIPVTGTGGTSLSMISSDYKVKLVGNAGGSVATTPLTKAISFSHALARTWGLRYRPWIAAASRTIPSWRSVLNSCLPAFWAVALSHRTLEYTDGEQWLPNANFLLEMLSSYALPMTCSVVMANSRRTSPGVLIGAALAASTCKRTVLGGLLAGWMVACLEEKLLYFCILYGNIPATMTNLVTTGFVGVLVAGVMTPVAPYLAELTETYRSSLVGFLVQENADDIAYELGRLFGLSLTGAIFCYGSKIGWYHSVFLPLILIEMEVGDAAILGAMDQLSLVLVSAGICAGTLFTCCFSRASTDMSLLKRGLLINLLCGDFIEACYPLMEQNVIISFGGYIASSCSIALLSTECKSSAYLPFPVALWLAEDLNRMSLASGVAFGIAFLSALVGAIFSPASRPTKED